MHYYQFNIGDYVKNTIHLSPMEDLAYRRLLDMYYDGECPIPNNIPLVSRRLRIDADIVESVLNEYFDLCEEGYRNHRADLQIEEYHAFLSKQKANGIKGGRPKKTQKKPMGNPSLTQTEPKITLTTNHKPLTNNSLSTVTISSDTSIAPDIITKAADNACVTDRFAADCLIGFKAHYDGKEFTDSQLLATLTKWVDREFRFSGSG